MKVPATPRGTGPSSRGEAGAVATVATPAADGVARGPRDAALRVTAPLHGASKGKKSARMSSRTDLPGTGDKFNNLNTFDVFSTHRYRRRAERPRMARARGRGSLVLDDVSRGRSDVRPAAVRSVVYRGPGQNRRGVVT